MILPVYNGEDFVVRAIESCLNQTFQDFQLLVVDDGSIDQTYQLVSSLAKTDLRVLPYSHPKNTGVVEAMSVGHAAIKDGTSPYIARMDADDINDPKRFERQIELLEKNRNLSAVSCKINVMGNEKNPEAKPDDGFIRFTEWQNSLVKHEDIFLDRFVELPLCNPTMMIRREVFKKLDEYQDVDGPEDYDFWLRFFEAGFQVEKVDEVLYHWQDHSTRLTRTDKRYDQSKFIKTKVRFLSRLEELKKSGVQILGTGRIARLIARGLMEHNISVHAFYDVAIRNVGREILGVPILSHDAFPEQKRSKHFTLIAVGGRGRRNIAEELVTSMGYLKGHDFLSVT